MKRTVLPLAAIAATMLLSSGCATVFLRSHDELKVVTDPAGAVARAGDASVVTPGVLKIARRKEPVVVRVEKEGFLPREVTVGWSRSGAVWVNVVGVSAGTAVGAVAGFWGSVLDDDKTRADARAAVLVGAAVTAVGLAMDLSGSKKYSLERDDLVLRLEPRNPAVGAADSGEGAFR